MNWKTLQVEARPHGLDLMGVLHDAGETVVLFGAGPDLWPVFQNSAEYGDGLPNPLDRWSKRIIAQLALPLDGTCVFPSDGPPYAPFIAWAKQTGQFWQSPTGMLIHDTAGLMISIRGAIRVPGTVPLPAITATSPCETCADQPCTTACPVGALSADTFYDVPTCKDHLKAPAGASCMEQGCLARRVCPISQAFERDPAQSAFHMAAFVQV